MTEQEGQVTIFAAIDHCTAYCIGIHVVKRAHWFEGLEPIRQAVREQFGSLSASAAAGVRLHHNYGGVYLSDDFQGFRRCPNSDMLDQYVEQVKPSFRTGYAA